MEYEQFYKFLETRPVKELNQCIHRIVDIVGSRFSTFQPQLESIQQAALSAIANIQKVADLDPEKARIDGILKSVVTTGISLPHGMNGYHRKDMRFVRWFPGTIGPVSSPKVFSTEHKVSTDWFLDQEFQVWLYWNQEGYFEMSRKDSLKFNLSQPLNKYLAEEARHGGVPEKRKTESVTGSEGRKKTKPSAPAVTEEPIRFTYLSSSSRSGTDSEEDHVLKIKPNGASSAAPKASPPKADPEPMDLADDFGNGHDETVPAKAVTEEDKAAEKEKELIRANSTSATAPTATPPKAVAPAKPIKGDTVYITGGKYSGTEGSVVGTRGPDSDMFRVQIANLIDGGSIIVQVPVDSLTLSRPATSRIADLSESYLSALRRSSVAPKPEQTVTSPAKKVIRKSSEPRIAPVASVYEAEHEKSVDEFFNNLSGSEDYFRALPAQVSDDASIPAPQPDSSSVAAVPKRTSFVLSDDSAPTQSLTTPPDMARDAETVSTVASAVAEETVVTTHMEISNIPEEEQSVQDVAKEPAVEVMEIAVESSAAAPVASVPAPVPESAKPANEPTVETRQSAASKSPRKKKLTGRPRAHKEGEEKKTWAFKCKCGDQCSSYENSIYYPAGEWFECSQCAVWSHVKCLLGDISLEKVAEMPEVLCFSCMSKARRNRSSRGATDSDPHAADLSSIEQTDSKPITLPVKITTATPVAAAQAAEKKRSHKRKPPAPAVPSLHPGQIVILLKGVNRGEEAEVIEPARAGPVVLTDVYKLKLCSAPDKVVQMPLEFLAKKEELLEELDAALKKPPSPMVAPTSAASVASHVQEAVVASTSSTEKPPPAEHHKPTVTTVDRDAQTASALEALGSMSQSSVQKEDSSSRAPSPAALPDQASAAPENPVEDAAMMEEDATKPHPYVPDGLANASDDAEEKVQEAEPEPVPQVEHAVEPEPEPETTMDQTDDQPAAPLEHPADQDTAQADTHTTEPPAAADEIAMEGGGKEENEESKSPVIPVMRDESTDL